MLDAKTRIEWHAQHLKMRETSAFKELEWKHIGPALMSGRVTDIGKIQPEKTVHVCFGDPLWIQGSGKNMHQKVVDFITHKISEWRAADTM